jgi:PPOX class probable F420-dependent enzyme
VGATAGVNAPRYAERKSAVTEIAAVPESHLDLLDVQTAAMATIGKDGRLQVTAIWFYYEASEGTLKMWLLDSRQKSRNLHANPATTIFIMDPKNAFRTLELRCRAEFAEDPDLTAMAGIAKKYEVTDFSIFDEPGDTRSAVFLYPEKVVTLDLPPLGWDDVSPK